MQGFGRLGAITMERDPAVARVKGDMGPPNGEVKLGDVDASGKGGGAIFIRGGQWVSRGGRVFADTYGSQNGRGVDVAVNGEMRLENGAWLGADTGGNGRTGEIKILVDQLQVMNGSQIHSGTLAQGKAGGVTVQAEGITIDGQGSTLSTGLASLAEKGSTGDAGTVSVAASGALKVLNGGQIISGTSAQGKAGGVIAQAGDITIDGQSSTKFTGLTSLATPGSTGDAGTVSVTANNALKILNGGAIGRIGSIALGNSQ
ncbi:hypothetical protein CCP4SC76_5010002 [Gammaproteobacteria bacterium]